MNILPHKDLLQWLEHTDSMTQKLLQKTNSCEVVHLQTKELQQHDWFAKYCLIDKAYQIREVVVKSANIVCWYARSYLTPQSFPELKNKSLGEIIFTNTNISREFLCYYPVNNEYIKWHWYPAEKIHWVRFSKFRIKSQASFYLFEIILPTTFLKLL